jgi:hypothetical protein
MYNKERRAKTTNTGMGTIMSSEENVEQVEVDLCLLGWELSSLNVSCIRLMTYVAEQSRLMVEYSPYPLLILCLVSLAITTTAHAHTCTTTDLSDLASGFFVDFVFGTLSLSFNECCLLIIVADEEAAGAMTVDLVLVGLTCVSFCCVVEDVASATGAGAVSLARSIRSTSWLVVVPARMTTNGGTCTCPLSAPASRDGERVNQLT